MSKMNEDFGDVNRHQIETGKIFVVLKNQTMSYINVLLAFYRQLSMGRNDTNFGRVLPEETDVRRHI